MNLGFDVKPEIQTLKVIYMYSLVNSAVSYFLFEFCNCIRDKFCQVSNFLHAPILPEQLLISQEEEKKKIKYYLLESQIFRVSKHLLIIFLLLTTYLARKSEHEKNLALE